MCHPNLDALDVLPIGPAHVAGIVVLEPNRGTAPRLQFRCKDTQRSLQFSSICHVFSRVFDRKEPLKTFENLEKPILGSGSTYIQLVLAKWLQRGVSAQAGHNAMGLADW